MKNDNLLLIGAGLGLAWLATRKAAAPGYTLPTQTPGTAQGGAVGKIVFDTPPGRTVCNDGTFSTHPFKHKGGVCSYHGGRLTSVREKSYLAPLKGEILEVTSFYSDVPVGTKGQVVKRWVDPYQNEWVKLYFGKNQGGQKLIKAFPTNVLKRKISIGAIYQEIPGNFYECNDGTYTDRNGRRACTWHGGLKSGEPIPLAPGGGSSFVQDVPLSKIQTKAEWFQNRSDAYSTRSVEAIVSAVLDGRFVWTNFDPIQLWSGPGGMLYILSGHSRKEAFKRLSEMGIVYQGRSFDTIPAKIETGLSLEQAQQVARESNTLSTPETALERAAYYRRLRQSGEFTLKQLEDAARRTEGRNANKVLAFSWLNTGGKTFAALEALQNADATSFANIETIAQWIGNARKTFPMLTNSHENELYDWLVTGGGYGTKSGQINSEAAFKMELQKIVMKRTEFGVFNPNEPLNIMSARYASPVEAEYNRQLDELRADIVDLEKQKRENIKRYAKDATPEDMRRILAPIEAGLRIKQQELQRLLLKKTEIMDAAKNQASLFGLRRRLRA